MTLFKRRQKKTPPSPKNADGASKSAKKTPFWMFWSKKAPTPAQSKKPQAAAAKTASQAKAIKEKTSHTTPKTKSPSQDKTDQEKTSHATPKTNPKHPDKERAALIAEALNIHREGQKIWAEVDPGLREGLARMVRGAWGLTETENKQTPPQESAQKNQASDASALTPPQESAQDNQASDASSLTPPQESAQKNQASDASALTPPPAQRK